MTLLKSSVSSLVSKTWNFSSILVVTNQSRINSNATRQSSTALLYVLWVLYPSGQHISIKGSS